MRISTAAKEYLIEIEVRNFTQKTIRSYRNNLNLFLRYCETEALIMDIEDVSLATIRQFTLYMISKGKKYCLKLASVVGNCVASRRKTYTMISYLSMERTTNKGLFLLPLFCEKPC